MRLTERLVKLDDKVLPRSSRWEWRGTYDQAFPMWMYLGGPLGALVGVVGGRMLTNGGGLVRVAGVAIPLLIIVVYIVAVRRWRRDHRLE
jgi:hypothetical protein